MGKTLGYGEITVANMTEPFTVMLTNEAQQFATDSNRKVTSAQSYYTDIIVIRGSQERTDYTIGNITSGSGITVSKSSKRVTFSVSADTTIGADTGVIEIPITLDGQTVKKQFSWSCGKQGPQGVKGNDGNSFAWNMLSETNCGKKHWGTESSGGKYSVEDFITEDNINAVKLICTEGISTSNWSYVLFKDIKMLKQLKPSTKYTLSYDIKANRSGAISHSICKGDASNFCTNTVVVNNIIGNETWQHISVVLTTNDLKTTPTNEILYLSRNALSKVGYSIIKNLKLVEGDIDTPWSPSQSDIEGKGVVETVQYYLATSQASGVTSSTSGWSTDITSQKLTADKKYLWNCYQTKYSDGTSEPISTPKVIGVYGDKGTSTKIIRTGYKYTQNNIDTFSASGYSRTWDTADATTGLKVGDNVLLRVKNTTKGSDCLIFASITAIPSNYSLTCTSYGLIDNGADGQDGKNAKNLSITPSSQYFKSTDGGKTFAPDTITIKPTIQGEINFGKWQYSIDGGVSFADAVSGQKGLTISNNVLTVSKDSSLYSDAVTMVTFRAVASDSSFYDTCSIAKIYDVSDIGDGRNLLTGVSSYTKDTPFEKTDSRADGWIVYQNIITSIELEAGKKYVLQAKTDGNWAANHDTNGQNPSKKLVTLWLCSDTTNDFFDMRQGYVVFTPTVTAKYKLRVNQYSNGTDAYTIHLWDIKLEKGSSPTGWTPAPEDVQTAILSTKSEISDVSLKVDNNKQAIEQRVEKTTYEQDLTLVKGDIGKANEGLNKWRYEIYPKSLFTNKPEDQRKISLDVFARNKNIIPTQSILLDDTKLGYSNYDDNYIGYAVTFVKMSEATKLETTFVHDDAGSFYLNGKLICTNGNNNFYSSATPDTVSCTLVKGWNCLEVVINEGTGSEGFKFGTVLSQLSTCQLMNCYYAMVTGRESQITNTLVQNTIDIEGVGTKVSKVTSVIGDNGENFTSFKNDYSDFKQTMNGFKTTVGQTYVTKDDFNGLEIGGVNLFVKSTASRGWWISNTGVLNADGGWGYSDYIDVSGMKNYIASGFTNLGISPATCFYDSNKTFISGVASKNQNSQDSKRKTLPIPSNAKYMRFSFALADIDTLKIEQGTKATAYSPAPEDDEINGQNLVSNLPSNWEQGTVTEGSTTGTTYANTKSSSAGSVRPKELIPVSGNITISTAYSNQSKKPIRHWIAAYDINKNYLGNNYVSNAWNSFPRTLNMKDAKYIAIMVGYTDSSAITPSDISQICLKIERGTSATPFTLAPEDVNGKIVNVETIANQTAKKFEWIVKGGDKSSSMVLTDDFLNIVANNINLTGKVTFNSLSSDAKNEIGKVAQSKVDGLDVGGRNLALQSKDFTSGEQYWSINSNFTRSVDSDGFTVLSIKRSGAGLEWNRAIPHNYIPVEEMHRGIIVSFDFMCDKVSELDRGCICALQIFNSGGGRIGWYESQDILSGIQCKLSEPLSDGKWIRVQVPFSEGDLKKTYGNSDAVAYASVSFNLVANGSIHFKKIKIEYGNKATDWTPAPEDYLPQADLVRNWTTNTTWIDGGKIYTGSITADKIATDAIKSRNYISSGGTQGSFLNLSDGSFTSPNLSWDSNGNLIATGANLSGQITATKGSIGKFKITDKWLITGSGSTCAGLGGNQAFWAGAEDSTVAPFRVEYDGKLTSSNADITGTITATNGKIGRYDITSTYLMTNSGSNASGIGGNQAFWAGAEDSNSAPFRVGYDGVLWAENAAIRGSIETGNLGDEGDTVVIMNGRIGIQGTSNNVEIYSTGFKFGIDGDYYLESVSEGVKCYRNLYATDFIADGWIYNASGGHYTWKDRDDAYISCGDYNGHNVYYYANYHAFYVNKDSGQGMMYINTDGVTSRVGFTKTSDERIKKNFESFDDNIIDAYMNIEPVKYQLKQSSNDKYHFGFKAQHIDKVFSDYGDIYNESFDICTSRPIDPDKAKELYGVDGMVEEYGLRYDELIAPTTYMVQHTYKELESTKDELTKVKQEKADLETRLQAIEAKLGL